MKLLEPNLIRLKVDAATPDEAIRAAGSLLVQSGLAERRYIDAMVSSFHGNGAYFVIAPHIAIPHARPEEGALESGISFVSLARPLSFGSEANDPVDLVFGLAAHSGDEHLQLIKKIVELLGNARYVEALRSMERPDEMNELLKEVFG
ncbi:PTS sugar transporter subunit IIA [Enorma sp.]|uniref:PTS sugar transporter subunit IIA n=1 Tax=Enorma sp. TaxID=1920692 RepID=UPI0025B9597A|nr:PTS sugar transporter subunit IIA [Enorma sp.]